MRRLAYFRVMCMEGYRQPMESGIKTMKLSMKPIAMRTGMILALISLLCASIPFARAEGTESFPLRGHYPDSKIIELADLQARFGEITVVDIRSPSEFEIMHVKGAVNVPLVDRDYHEQIRKLAEGTGGKPMAFYCNGHNCERAFQAEVKARQMAGVKNGYVFDGGIFDWVEANPELTRLLDKDADPRSVISASTFKKHLLSPEAFVDQARPADRMIIDIRDTYESDGISLFATRDIRTGFDKAKIREMISAAAQRGQTVFFYDANGNRIKLLQYIIEDAGLKDYYLMEGGLTAYFRMLQGK